MSKTAKAKKPPNSKNLDGKPRRVGVEVEFAELDLKAAAGLIRDQFGGKVVNISPQQLEVEKTSFGTFKVELDTQFAHAADLKNLPEELEAAKETIKKVDENVKEVIGNVSKAFVPFEIVCPPVEWSELGKLNGLFRGLQSAGAKGTKGSPVYAFGLHLNPEISDDSVEYLLMHLRAFVILSDWLREEINLDLTRKILPHINPFPAAYVKTILDPEYKPGRRDFIEDYIKANPTRNRGLDMLPVFAFLESETVKKAIEDPRIKPRPTFHYRLPDARVSSKGWNAVQEWNRWLAVERLAADQKKLKTAAERFMEFHAKPFAKGWAQQAAEFA